MISDIIQFEFLRNALLAGILTSVICGIIGSYIVVRRIVFISGGISHAAFGGIGLGYYAGFNPVYGAVIFSVLSAMMIGFARKSFKQSEDTLIGILWAIGMALGILFISLTPGYSPDLFGYLFGNILTVPISDIYMMLILTVFVILIVVLFYKDILVFSFDEEFSTLKGRPVNFIYYMMLALIGLTVVTVIKIVGIILVISLLTIPAAVAIQYTKKLRSMMILSVFLGIVFTTSGLYLSYKFDLQSGATIILTATVFYIFNFVLKRISGKAAHND